MSSAPGTRRRRRPRLGIFATDVGVGLASAVLLLPFVIVLLTSVKSTADVIQDPLGLPSAWRFHNFVTAWSDGHFGGYFLNSVLVVVPTVVAILAFALLAAFAFATADFPGKSIVFALFIVGLTIPLDILIIPLFYEMLSFGLLDTLPALILPQVAIGLPFAILLLRGFIQDIPVELFEAGTLDGCSRFRLLRHIVLPLTRPALASLVVFNFMWTWNQFLLPTVLIQSDGNRTLPVGLNYFQGRYITDVPLLMAGVTISFLPIVVVYVLFQRHLIRGITIGALK